MSHMQLDNPGEQLWNNLHALNSITDKLAEYEEDLEQLLQTMLALTASMFHFSYASIMLLDQKLSQFPTVVTYGDFPLDIKLEAVTDISKLVRCTTTNGKMLTFTRLADNSKWDRLKPEEQKCLSEVLCSPLLIHHKIVGVACVYGEDSDPEILKSEEFSLWAKLATLAIEKSRLYNQIHRRLEITSEELKRSQSQLIRSEKLSSLAEIAMSVAHAIRNPVTAIGGLSRRLHRQFPQDDSRQILSEMILSEASRLESIVKDFERFFSINQISFQREDVNQLVEEVADDFLSECQDRPHLSLNLALLKEPLICRVDPELLYRCLIHLLANARDASDNGIRITLTTAREGKNAIIDVVDTGKGMSRKEMNHVFDPFYSTKGEGAGMGLTFVHFVISEHGGQIDVTSEESVGTRFHIRLPLEG